MTRPIADLWAGFAERVLPTDAGTIQTQETKRAFYGGAHALFELIAHASATRTEEFSLKLMTSIQEDAELFCKEVETGKA